jgi:hypothetical protein
MICIVRNEISANKITDVIFKYTILLLKFESLSTHIAGYTLHLLINFNSK